MSEALERSIGLKNEARDKIVNVSRCKKLFFRFTVQRMFWMNPLDGFPARTANISLVPGEKLLTVETGAREDKIEERCRESAGKMAYGC